MEVGQKIKLVRLHRGLTQKQLGDLLNLGDGGANRIAQYEIGYRVPKPSLLKEIAKVLDVKEETFFVSDKFLPDILRTIMWYDFEHRRSFKLAETTLDASIAPIESKTIELRGNACTTWGDSIAPATVLWVNVPLFNDLMKEWLTRKQELASGTITKSDGAVLNTGLPETNMLIFELDGGRLILRPSGTEPKLKAYCSARGDSRESAEQYLGELEKAAKELMNKYLG